MPFSQILRVFQTISLGAFFILPLVIGVLRSLVPNPIRVQNIVHYVGCHPTKGYDVNITLRVYFAPTNFTLSAYLASKHFGDSACFGLQNLRDSANLLKILFKVT